MYCTTVSPSCWLRWWNLNRSVITRSFGFRCSCSAFTSSSWLFSDGTVGTSKLCNNSYARVPTTVNRTATFLSSVILFATKNCPSLSVYSDQSSFWTSNGFMCPCVTAMIRPYLASCYDLLFKVCMHAFPICLCGLWLDYASNQLHSHILLHIKTLLTNVQQGGVFIHTLTRVHHVYNMHIWHKIT